MNKTVKKLGDGIADYLGQYGWYVEACEVRRFRGDYGSIMYDVRIDAVAPDGVWHEMIATFFDAGEPCDMTVDDVRLPMPDLPTNCSPTKCSPRARRIASALAVHALKDSQTCIIVRDGGDWVVTLDDGREYRWAGDCSCCEFLRRLECRGLDVYATVPVDITGHVAKLSLGLWRDKEVISGRFRDYSACRFDGTDNRE